MEEKKVKVLRKGQVILVDYAIIRWRRRRAREAKKARKLKQVKAQYFEASTENQHRILDRVLNPFKPDAK